MGLSDFEIKKERKKERKEERKKKIKKERIVGPINLHNAF